MTGTDGFVLQERDRRLLEALSSMRVMDRDQAMAVAGFHSIARANVRLLKLTTAGLLVRLYVGSRAGNRKALYLLSRKGAAIVGANLHYLHRRSGLRLIIDPLLEHQLAINTIRVSVCHKPSPEGVAVKCWRTFQSAISSLVPLRPDGYFEVQKDSAIYPMFLEVDRGTEGQKVWKNKIELYLRLALSGEFARVFGQEQFRVLVVTTSTRRLQTIRQSVAAYTDKIFWFGVFEIINRDGFWSEAWHRAKPDQRRSLF